MKLAHIVVLLSAVTLNTAASAVAVYTNDFDSAPTVAGGVTAAFNAGGGTTQSTIAPYTSYGSVYRNSSLGLTSLTLSDLPDHSSVDVGFIMAFLDSWDSTDGTPAPDYLNLFVDGNPVAQYTYNNASGTVKAIGGGSLLAQYVQFDGNLFYSDTVVDMQNAPELIFPHTASTLTLGWQAGGGGWQVGGDEAWGIDNVSVELAGTAVPLPPAFVLFVSAFALFMTALPHRASAFGPE